jgi:hypothetical protein
MLLNALNSLNAFKQHHKTGNQEQKSKADG